jgi:hypothetical protein
VFDVIKFCRQQYHDYARFAAMADLKIEAETLKKISETWLQLAGHVSKYNTIIRNRAEQQARGMVPRPRRSARETSVCNRTVMSEAAE